VIGVGEMAPDFRALTEKGTPLQLSSLRGAPTILFFFPKSNSMGCTVETRAFADHAAEIRAAGVNLVGVSVDPVATQAGFAAKCHVDFPLVADSDKAVSRAFGVLGFLGFARRVTFFLDPGGRVEEVVEAIGPNPHVKRAMERVRGHGRAGPAPGRPES
jgi:peroxiredoxin Q/BCP